MALNNGTATDIFAGILVLGALTLTFAQFIKLGIALATTPASDLTRIRANLAGVLGEAGPSKEVTNIIRAGTILPRRGVPTARKYLVTLKSSSGDEERRFVTIEATFFGRGAMTIEKNHARPAPFALP